MDCAETIAALESASFWVQIGYLTSCVAVGLLPRPALIRVYVIVVGVITNVVAQLLGGGGPGLCVGCVVLPFWGYAVSFVGYGIGALWRRLARRGPS